MSSSPELCVQIDTTLADHRWAYLLETRPKVGDDGGETQKYDLGLAVGEERNESRKKAASFVAVTVALGDRL